MTTLRPLDIGFTLRVAVIEKSANLIQCYNKTLSSKVQGSESATLYIKSRTSHLLSRSFNLVSRTLYVLLGPKSSISFHILPHRIDKISVAVIRSVAANNFA